MRARGTNFKDYSGASRSMSPAARMTEENIPITRAKGTRGYSDRARRIEWTPMECASQ